MELAASLRPFKKSNVSATAMRPMRRAMAGSSDVLDDNAADAVREVLETIHHLLEVIIDLDANNVVHGVTIPVPLEKCLDPFVIHRVGVVFEPDDLLRDLVQSGRILAHCADELDGLHS